MPHDPASNEFDSAEFTRLLHQNKYRLVAKAGEGTFSEVLKAQSIVTGEYFAIKCMKAYFKNMEQVNSLREIQALRRLNPHANIVDLEEVLYDKQTGRLALVFELMDQNIYELIRNRKQHLKPQYIKILMYQLCKAVAHMHKHGIFHRDIKPENILIKRDNILKVSDLGSCRGVYTQAPYTEYISTRWYRAPECLLTNGYYDYKMDVWGVGAVMFEIMSLFPLFPGTNEMDQIDKIHMILGTPTDDILEKFKQHSTHIKNFNFPPKQGSGLARLIPHATPDAIDLMEKLLTYNPEHRLTARQALRHPYFREIREAEKRERMRTASPKMRIDDGNEIAREREWEREKEKEEAVKRKRADSKKFPSINNASSSSSSSVAAALPSSTSSSIPSASSTSFQVTTQLNSTHSNFHATSKQKYHDELYNSSHDDIHEETVDVPLDDENDLSAKERAIMIQKEKLKEMSLLKNNQSNMNMSNSTKNKSYQSNMNKPINPYAAQYVDLSNRPPAHLYPHAHLQQLPHSLPQPVHMVSPLIQPLGQYNVDKTKRMSKNPSQSKFPVNNHYTSSTVASNAASINPTLSTNTTQKMKMKPQPVNALLPSIANDPKFTNHLSIANHPSAYQSSQSKLAPSLKSSSSLAHLHDSTDTSPTHTHAYSHHDYDEHAHVHTHPVNEPDYHRKVTRKKKPPVNSHLNTTTNAQLQAAYGNPHSHSHSHSHPHSNSNTNQSHHMQVIGNNHHHAGEHLTLSGQTLQNSNSQASLKQSYQPVKSRVKPKVSGLSSFVQ